MSGSSRWPSPAAGMVSWRHLGLVVTFGILLAAISAGERMALELFQLRGQDASLMQRGASAEKQLKELQMKYVELFRTHQQLVADRDNVLAQTKRLFKEKDQIETERALLEEAFRRTASDRLALLSRLVPLEEQFTNLQQDLGQLVKDREQLQRQLAKEKDRSKEQALRTQLAGMHRKQMEMQRTLAQKKRELRDVSGKEQKISRESARLKDRLGTLQKEYTEEVSENASLRRRVERLPKDVGSLAREHERLLQDMADTHYNMGVMFAKRRDFVRAAREFQKVVELKPDDAEAHYNLGVIYAEHIPDREKAISFFRRYLSFKPKGEDANFAKQYLATWQAWEGKERLE